MIFLCFPIHTISKYNQSLRQYTLACLMLTLPHIHLIAFSPASFLSYSLRQPSSSYFLKFSLPIGFSWTVNKLMFLTSKERSNPNGPNKIRILILYPVVPLDFYLIFLIFPQRGPQIHYLYYFISHIFHNPLQLGFCQSQWRFISSYFILKSLLCCFPSISVRGFCLQAAHTNS